MISFKLDASRDMIEFVNHCCSIAGVPSGEAIRVITPELDETHHFIWTGGGIREAAETEMNKFLKIA